MYESLTHVTPGRVRETPLLIDSGAGVILEAPPLASISRRNVEHNPWIVSASFGVDDSDRVEHIFAGPDAKSASLGHRSNDNFVEYTVLREVAGFLEISRVA
jgi:hypothetical protein